MELNDNFLEALKKSFFNIIKNEANYLNSKVYLIGGFVRDHLRIRDEITCAAARVIVAVREHARKNAEKNGRRLGITKKNSEGLYDAFHVRRGDFADQFEKTQISAEEMYNSSKVSKRKSYLSADSLHHNLHVYLSASFSIYRMSLPRVPHSISPPKKRTKTSSIYSRNIMMSYS